ncbi:MAG: serine protease [bacterium]|nr:serine protease [bacterium]
MSFRLSPLSILLFLGVFLLVGCTSSPSTQTPLNPVQTTYLPEQTLISFSQSQELPTTDGSPVTHRGYGVRIDNQGHLLTVKHILPEVLSELVISDQQGGRYLIKQLRFDPELDLALLQVEENSPLPPFLLSRKKADLPTTGYFFSGENILSSQMLPKDEKYALLLGQTASPGASGSPVRDEDNKLVGLIEKQTEQ